MQIILMIVCFLLIGIVLIQPSKADTNSALSGGNDNLFKNRKERGGELFITRLTLCLGIVYFAICMIQGFQKYFYTSFIFIERKNYEKNTNKIIDIKDESIVNNLSFKTLSIIKVNDLYSISTQIFNNGDKSKIDSFDIVIKDKNSNILVTLKGIVGDVLDSNDYVKVITSTFDDLNDMYSIEYKV